MYLNFFLTHKRNENIWNISTGTPKEGLALTAINKITCFLVLVGLVMFGRDFEGLTKFFFLNYHHYCYYYYDKEKVAPASKLFR